MWRSWPAQAGALGHATTATRAARGRTVVAVNRNEHALRDLPDDIRREVANTTDPAAATRLIDRIASEVWPPDVPVNTIGAFRPGDAATMTPETLRLMIDVNLDTALWLSKAVAPHLRQQGSDAIVHLAARPGIEPSGGTAAYNAGKAALVHLTRILDIDLRPHGIRVNAVALPLLDTRIPGHVPEETMAHAVLWRRGATGCRCVRVPLRLWRSARRRRVRRTPRTPQRPDSLPLAAQSPPACASRRWTSATAIDPSPMAAAQRLTDPQRCRLGPVNRACGGPGRSVPGAAAARRPARRSACWSPRRPARRRESNC